MKKTYTKLFALVALIALASVLLCFSVSAENERLTDGVYTYTVKDGKATIVGGGVIDGELVIPSVVDGYPVTAVGSKAYQWNKNITSVVISEGVETIGDGAFYHVSYMETIALPASLSDVGKNPFLHCYHLESIIVDEDSPYYSNDEYGVLFNKDKTKLVRYPMGNEHTSYSIPDTVKTVGSRAFYWSDKLVEITIPDSVTSFEPEAFAFVNITSAVIPDGVTKVEDGLFYGCNELAYVTIPDSVTSIGKNAFTDAVFDTFTISENITSIGDTAFWGCHNLKSITIPSNVKSIGKGAFSDTSLAEVIICDGVEFIGDYAFENCFDLVSVKIPNSVTSIGSCAFGWFFEETDWGDGSYKYSDFTITAGECSAAHKYADKYDFIFIDDGSKDHSFTTVSEKATFETDGSVVTSCECGETKTETYPAVTSVTLSTEKYVYNGKNRTPKVTVKDKEGNVLTKNVDYKLSVASNRSGIGRYTVKVTLIGNYEGTKKVFFYILPGVTSEVKSTARTTSSIKLSWKPVDGAKGYKVYRYSTSKKAYVLAATTEKTSVTVSKLYDGTKYTFRVVAYGETAAGKPYDSAKYALIRTATCTETPTVKLSSTSKGKVKVTWSEVSGETGYQVWYSTSKDGSYKKLSNIATNKNDATASGLTDGKTYYFKVRTYKTTDSGYVYSPFSTVQSIKVK